MFERNLPPSETMDEHMRKTSSPEVGWDTQTWNELHSSMDNLLLRLNNSPGLVKIAYRQGMDIDEYNKIVEGLERLHGLFAKDFLEQK